MLTPPHFETFTELLCWRAKEHPQKIAFRFFPDGETETETITYGELDQRARILGQHLFSKGYQGQRVLLLYPPGIDFVIAFVSCLYAGVIPVPAYPPEPHRLAHTLKRLQKVILDAQSPAVLTLSALIHQADAYFATTPQSAFNTLDWIATEQEQNNKIHQSPLWLPPTLTGEDIAFLQYTSGSTGDPKGVMITHRNLLVNESMIKEAFEHKEQAPVLVCWVPFYHDMGLVGHILQSLFVGGETLIMPPTAFLKKPLRWLQLISKYKGTSTGAPNFAYDLCVRKITPAERDCLDLSSLRLTLNGAEPIQADTVKRFIDYFAPAGYDPASMYPAYGMAEATVFIAGCLRSKRPAYLTVQTDALAENKIVTAGPNETESIDSKKTLTLISCGQPWQDGAIRIVRPDSDKQGIALPENNVGEIWLKGSHIATGYWQKEAQTAHTFGATIEGESGVFCRTGDLGFLRDGQIFVTGRLKDLIIVRGRNLYPQDIEHSIDLLAKTQKALRPGCGVAFAHTADATETVVIVQEVHPKLQTAPNLEHLLKQAQQDIITRIHTEHNLLVHEVVLIKPGTLPKTSSGKLMRQQARKAYQTNFKQSDITPIYIAADTDKNAPETPAAEKEWATWLFQWLKNEANLTKNSLPLKDSFQMLGLNSVLSLQLVADLETYLQTQLKKEISLSDTLLWEHSTPQALLDYLTTLLNNKATINQPPAKGSTKRKQEPIAVVGMSMRFPGGLSENGERVDIRDPEAFWDLLKNGADAITEIPTENWRWNQNAIYAPEKGIKGKSYLKHGGFLNHIEQFDPSFFKISPKEALHMDPQQRLLMELAWEAFESAQWIPEDYTESNTGVFVGLSNQDYSLRNMHATTEQISHYSGTGVSPSVAAGRIAYAMDLQGPAITVDTACSSSLVAIHQACQSIRNGECDQALAGGVNLILSPHAHVYFSQVQALSHSGRCRTFSADADGFVRSEGGGLVMLKSLTQATQDGDQILGVIHGSALNHDGRSNGLMAPSVKAQHALLVKALASAHVTPDTIDFIETHGTATPLGDPIEVEAIQKTFLNNRETPLYLGAVRSNMGHLESAAGISGFIKALLVLQHQSVPPNLHYETPNPRLPKHEHLKLPTAATPASIRLAGVSGFGFSGTNAHLILGPAPIKSKVNHRQNASHAAQKIPVYFSAQSRPALKTYLQQIQKLLATPVAQTPHFINRLSLTTTKHRSIFAYRQGFAVNSVVDLKKEIEDTLNFGLPEETAQTEPKTVFVFPGQGGQWLGMGKQLFETEIVFKKTFTAVDALVQEEAQWSLIDLMMSEKENQTLSQVQPFLFAMQIALAACWQAQGIAPDMVIGHSMGEVAAAYISGHISLKAAVQIMCRRSELLAQQNHGAMLMVQLSATEIEPRLTSDLVIAAYNSPQSTVVSGNQESLAHLENQLKKEAIFCRPIKVKAASHSPQVEPLKNDLITALQELETPQSNKKILPMASSVSGQWIDHELNADYWYQNLRQPVHFEAAVKKAGEKGANIWVEINPHPLLLGNLKEIEACKNACFIASGRKNQNEHETLWQAFMHYARVGSFLKLSFASDFSLTPVNLPPYAWTGKDYMLPYSKAYDKQTVAKPPLKKIPQQIWHLQWQNSAAPKPQKTNGGYWLVFVEKENLFWGLQMLLQGQGEKCVQVKQGHELQLKHPPFVIDSGNPEHYQKLCQTLQQKEVALSGVVWNWETLSSKTFTPKNATSNYTMLASLLQALSIIESPSRLYALHTPNLAQSVWQGLLLSAFYEYPQWHSTLIQLPENPTPQVFQNLAEELFSDSAETRIKLSPQRQVARMVSGLDLSQPAAPTESVTSTWKQWFSAKKPKAPQALHRATLQIKPQRRYLITGGLGLLGFETAKWLLKQGATELVLMGRTGIATEQQSKYIANWKQKGLNIEIFKGDITHSETVKTLLKNIHGVVHCAGVLQDGLIAGQKQQQIEKVLAPKITGSWLLHKHSQHLDFFICYSSITAPLGMPGQSNYAAANTFMDALMLQRQQEGKTGLSVQWGPWERENLTGNSERLLLSQYGFSQLTLKEGFECLSEIVEAQAAGAAVMGLNLQHLLKRLPHTKNLPLYSEVARAQEISFEPSYTRYQQTASTPVNIVAAKQHTQTASTAPSDSAGPFSQEELTHYLHITVAEILGIPPAGINTQGSLRGYGFDSLMALELKAQLQEKYKTGLSGVERFQSMSIHEMSERLCFPERFQEESKNIKEDKARARDH